MTTVAMFQATKITMRDGRELTPSDGVLWGTLSNGGQPRINLSHALPPPPPPLTHSSRQGPLALDRCAKAVTSHHSKPRLATIATPMPLNSRMVAIANYSQPVCPRYAAQLGALSPDRHVSVPCCGCMRCFTVLVCFTFPLPTTRVTAMAHNILPRGSLCHAIIEPFVCVQHSGA